MMPTPVEDREKGWVGVYVNEEERRGVFVLKFVLLNIFGKHFTIFLRRVFFFLQRVSWLTKGLEIMYFTGQQKD